MAQEVTLAIDYGVRRVGVAVSAGVLARPLTVMPHGRRESLIARLLDLAHEEQVGLLLVGLPLNGDGSIGPQAEKTMRFARALAAATSLPVYLWDERRSSVAAQQALIATGRRRKARQQQLDAYAAAAFLQDYLDEGGRGAILVEPPPPVPPSESSDD
ncbi:MAG: Holliday junction resolvase RuvX [Ardenticatenaceae bacterium]|nr:Holliday junction resolvase RuvX [Ardenticatenaceae bacterium]